MNMAELINRSREMDVAELHQVKTIDPHTRIETLRDKNFAVVNRTTLNVAAMVSDHYTITQHREVAEGVARAISNLNIKADAKFEATKSRNRMFLYIDFPDAKIHLKEVGEEFIAGLRVINSYDTTTGILVVPQLKRLACKNGMVVTRIAKGFYMKHRQNLTKDFEVVIGQTLNRIIESNELLKKMVNDCIKDSIEWEMLELVLKNLLASEKHREAVTEIMKQNYDARFNRWSLYNSITSYCSHNEQLKPNVEHSLQGIAQKLLVTPLAQLARREE